MALLLVVAVLGAVLIGIVTGKADRWLRWLVDDAEAGGWGSRVAVALLSTAIALPLLVLGAYSARLGRHVRRDDRFPPANMPVLRDTEVLTGPPARRRAERLVRLGWGLAGVGVAIGGACWWIMDRLLDSLRR